MKINRHLQHFIQFILSYLVFSSPAHHERGFFFKNRPKEAWNLPRGIHRSKYGLGVFATKFLPKGTLVDICPVAPFGRNADILWNYRFTGGTALGMCSMFNHNDNENLEQTYEPMGNFEFKRYYANRDIAIGEELCINYGSEWFSSRDQVSDTTIYFVKENDLPPPSFYYYGPSSSDPAILGLYVSRRFREGEVIETCPFLSSWADFGLGKKSTAISIPLLPKSECGQHDFDSCPKGCLKRKDECWECTNNIEYFDVMRSRCVEWEGYSCDSKTFQKWNYSESEGEEILWHCPAACQVCERHPLSATHRVVFGNCPIYRVADRPDDPAANIEMVMTSFTDTDKLVYSVTALRDILSHEELVLDISPFQSHFDFRLVPEPSKPPTSFLAQEPEFQFALQTNVAPPPRMIFLIFLAFTLMALFRSRFVRQRMCWIRKKLNASGQDFIKITSV